METTCGWILTFGIKSGIGGILVVVYICSVGGNGGIWETKGACGRLLGRSVVERVGCE